MTRSSTDPAASAAASPEHDGRRTRALRLIAAAVTLSVLALTGASGAHAATLSTRSTQSAVTGRTSASADPAAFGTLRVSRVVGRAANGARFVGRYHVTRFVVRHQKVRAVGRLTGTLTRPNGATRDVSRRVRMPVNIPASGAANPVGPRVARLAAAGAGLGTCQVLNLVLGPLDLNLLGLVVHLNQVVLTITAIPGAGALLGNLLCAVAGLLDGAGLGGLNAILANLLNAILGILSA
jgi:hypothetical protein